MSERRTPPPTLRAIIYFAGGEATVARACEMSVEGVRKWIRQDEAGKNPLRNVAIWRVYKLSELTGVPPHALAGIVWPPPSKSS